MSAGCVGGGPSTGGVVGGVCVGGIRAAGHSKTSGPKNHQQSSSNSSRAKRNLIVNAREANQDKTDTLSDNKPGQGTTTSNDTNLNKNFLTTDKQMDIVKEETND